MAIKIRKDSHTDHNMTAEQMDWVIGQFADRTQFFIVTVQLPASLGMVLCNLHGPEAGTPPVIEAEVEYRRRGERTWNSRLCGRPPHETRMVTIIAGPDGDDPMVLYTIYGGPAAPKEPTDPNIKDEEKPLSEAFWKHHALSWR